MTMWTAASPLLLLCFLRFFVVTVTADGAEDTTSLRGEPSQRRLAGQVTGFELIDTSGFFGLAHRKVADLTDGAVINLQELGMGDAEFNIKAVGSDLGSVQFDLDGKTNYSTESWGPYHLCGDLFFGLYVYTCPGVLSLGQHTLTATPNGDASAAVSITFTVVQSVNPAMACPVPQFVGQWEPMQQHPKPLAESQGGIIGGQYLLMTGGFDAGYGQTTSDTYRLDLSDPNAVFEKQDSYPRALGITHGASLIIGDKFYICGGYLGGHPGPHIPDCYMFDNTIAPGNGQWTKLPSLPEGRGGGGMTHNVALNTLTYAGGAERPSADSWFYLSAIETIDYQHTWTLELDNIRAGWQVEIDIPYLANHMSFATALDKDLNEHQYYFGGQMGDQEYTGNLVQNYEWDAINKQWAERTSLPFPRGHAGESTRPISCGFLVAAGTTNSFAVTRDISYYDIASDSWIKIGDMPGEVRTPVCDIRDGWLYCNSGRPWTEFFNWRRKIVVPSP